MTANDHIPAAALQPYVKAFKIIESVDGDVNRILPGTSLALAFRLKGQTEYTGDGRHMMLPSAVVSGLRRSVRLVGYAPGSATLVVMFTATGASIFFRQPLHELFEQSVSLGDIFLRSEVERVEECLFEAGSEEEKVGIVERFLVSKMKLDRVDRMVSNAVRQIEDSKGVVKIKELAGSLFISQDAFEKRFRRVTGASPKHFASIVRLQHIVRAQRFSSLTELAYESGYYDQSHFNKDIKLFTGLTPGELYRSTSFW